MISFHWILKFFYNVSKKCSIFNSLSKISSKSRMHRYSLTKKGNVYNNLINFCFSLGEMRMTLRAAQTRISEGRDKKSLDSHSTGTPTQPKQKPENTLRWDFIRVYGRKGPKVSASLDFHFFIYIWFSKECVSLCIEKGNIIWRNIGSSKFHRSKAVLRSILRFFIREKC